MKKSIHDLIAMYDQDRVRTVYTARRALSFSDEYDEVYNDQKQITDVLMTPGMYNAILLALDLDDPKPLNNDFQRKMKTTLNEVKK